MVGSRNDDSERSMANSSGVDGVGGDNGAFVDIELASLGRFENILGTIVRVLHEETDAIAPAELTTFHLTLVRRGGDEGGSNDGDGRYIVSNMTHGRKIRDDDECDDLDDDEDDEEEERECDSDDEGYCDGEISRRRRRDRTFDEIRRFAIVDTSDVPEWLDTLDRILRRREDVNDDREAWLLDRAWRLVCAFRRFERIRLPTERQRLDVLRRVRVIPELTASTDVFCQLHTWLFFQWFKLMAVFPVAYDGTTMNFGWMSDRSSVRVYSRGDYCVPGSIGQLRCMPSHEEGARVVSHESILKCSPTTEPFSVTDGRAGMVDSTTRTRHAKVLAMSETDMRAKTRKRRADAEFDINAHKRRRSDAPRTTATMSAAAAKTTPEQRRVLTVIETTLTERPVGARRVVVDGVAGAGKTFMLGVLLRKFRTVRYLVKKRTFVEATERRFASDSNRLRACTIDAFLMRHLGIRDLPLWLKMRSERLEHLRQLLMLQPLPRDDDELVFVDEYSLIEGSLAELLSLALVNWLTVIVGDCNQQSAIGDASDQPIRTLLGYETVCFMYDNVRTKDSRLLRRLSHFNVRSDDSCLLSIEGLPFRDRVDLSEYIAAATNATARSVNRNAIPRIIVVSNENVNYLNWAMCSLVRGHLDCSMCLRYSRQVVHPPETIAAIPGSLVDDDAFADEHFVILGLRYRIIHAVGPAQPGTRVIVIAILSDDTVVVSTDDHRSADDPPHTFTITKMLVRPYEYHSKWNRVSGARLYMFPFVLDAATTVYQVQGLTLDSETYANCYIDVRGMDYKALNVSLSRFQNEAQIRGIANPQVFLC